MRHSHANVLWRLCMIIRQYMFVHHCLEILIKNAALTHKSTFQVGHAPFVPGCRMLRSSSHMPSRFPDLRIQTSVLPFSHVSWLGYAMGYWKQTLRTQWPDRSGLTPDSLFVSNLSIRTWHSILCTFLFYIILCILSSISLNFLCTFMYFNS